MSSRRRNLHTYSHHSRNGNISPGSTRGVYYKQSFRKIHLTDYNVTKLALLVQDPDRNELNHTDMDSWPPLA